jgi:Zn-dependent protease
MWARTIEVLLACFLAISPFLFSYPGDATFLWINDYAVAFIIIVLALLSTWHPLRKLHLAILLVAFWLIGVVCSLGERPLSPIFQNYLILSFLLAMLAIVPCESDLPPHPWRDFYDK